LRALAAISLARDGAPDGARAPPGVRRRSVGPAAAPQRPPSASLEQRRRSGGASGLRDYGDGHGSGLGNGDGHAAAPVASGGGVSGGVVHVPYRQSLLTRVLSDAFSSGEAAVAVLATISPGSSDTEVSARAQPHAQRSARGRLRAGALAPSAPARASGCALYRWPCAKAGEPITTRAPRLASPCLCSRSPRPRSPCAQHTLHTLATVSAMASLDSWVRETKSELGRDAASMPPPPPSHPKEWTRAQLEAWLRALDGGAYSAVADALPQAADGKLVTRMPRGQFGYRLCADDTAEGGRLFDALHAEMDRVAALKATATNAARGVANARRT
jgi:hypothetical protein